MSFTLLVGGATLYDKCIVVNNVRLPSSSNEKWNPFFSNTSKLSAMTDSPTVVNSSGSGLKYSKGI